jgi:DNA-binding IclR family transcriptional regulator
MRESVRHVEAVLKAMDILDCFQVQPTLSLKQISQMTGLNKSRIIRLCGSLAAKGVIAVDSETHKYKLGVKILSLSRVYEQSNTLISLARPILRDLAQRSGESATLFVPDGCDRLCLAREEGTHSIRFNIVEGQRLPIHAGAGGKVLLAFGSSDLREKILQKTSLRKLTRNTITDPQGFRQEIKAIRQQGFAFSSGERDSEVAALAAPIYNHEDRICAALSVAGPIHRFSSAHNAENLKLLLAAAVRLSTLLGHKPDPFYQRDNHHRGRL